MAKAMPAINRADAANHSLNNMQDVSSLFSMLLESMMQGLETNKSATGFTQENQSFSQLTNTPFPFNLKQSSGEEVSTIPSVSTDLNFQPVQFLKLDSTLAGKLSDSAIHFINAGKKYDINPNLLSAIAIHETGNGSSKAAHEKNNIAGMMGRNGLRSYDSVEESIFDMARNLRQNYLNLGKTTITEIGAKYAPVGAANDPTGLNNHWTTGVSRQLNKLT
nr:glucosaminidase domain-containing protein [Sporosarcina jiandibaonis]